MSNLSKMKDYLPLNLELQEKTIEQKRQAYWEAVTIHYQNSFLDSHHDMLRQVGFDFCFQSLFRLVFIKEFQLIDCKDFERYTSNESVVAHISKQNHPRHIPACAVRLGRAASRYWLCTGHQRFAHAILCCFSHRIH